MAEEINIHGLTEDEKSLIEEILSENENDLTPAGESRRQFLKMSMLTGGGLLALKLTGARELFAQPLENSLAPASVENLVKVAFRVNNNGKLLDVDSRMTLLDALRERLGLTGSKKGCDHGQCGACTVIVNGRRVLSCLTLAACCEDKSVTTIEGLATGNRLSPMQASFIKHDGFQCGYCTPGQICSATALMDEASRGELSYLSTNVRSKANPLKLLDEEIKERMSGNICRCGAFPNIVDAIKEVHLGKDVAQNWQFSNGENEQGTVSSTETQKGGNYASV